MRSILERDLSTELPQARFFTMRAIVAGTPVLGLIWVGLTTQGQPTDEVGLEMFTVTGRLVLLPLLVFVPQVFAPALARERVANALEVLRTTPAPPSGILIGIWVGRLLIILLLIACSLPMVAMAMTFGGITSGLFLAYSLLVLMTVVWTSALSLAAGAFVRDVVGAVRTSYVLVAIALLVMPTIGGIVVEFFGTGVGTSTAARALGLLSPFNVLSVLQAERRWTDDVQTALLAQASWTVVITLLGLTAGARRIGSEGSRAVSARRNRSRSRLLGGLIDRYPMLWLGMSRRLRLRLTAIGTLGLLAIAIAEYQFITELVRAEALVGRTGFIPIGATRELHTTYVFGYLALAAAAAMVSAATAFHRELQTNALHVLYASPLSNGQIIRGLFAASLIAALPFWILSVAHAIVGASRGIFEVLGAVMYLVTSFLAIVCVASMAFLGGLNEPRPARAVVLTFMRTIGWWGAIGIVALLFSPTIMLFDLIEGLYPVVMLTFWSVLPPFFAVAPLEDPFGAPTLGVLAPSVAYVIWIRIRIQETIPKRFVQRSDPRMGSRQLVKHLRVERRGMAYDGQARPQA